MTHPSAQTPMSIDDIPIQYFERGPIRDMLEVIFEVAVDRARRRGGFDIPAESEKYLHDTILPTLCVEVLEEAKSLKKKGEVYVLSPSCQKHLQDRIEEEILASVMVEGEIPGGSFGINFCPEFCYLREPSKERKESHST